MKSCSITLLTAVVLGSSFQAAAQNRPSDYVPREIVVKFSSSISPATRRTKAAAVASAMNAAVVRQNSSTALLDFDEHADVESLAAEISTMNGVEYAEPNYMYSIPDAEIARVGVQAGATPVSVTRAGKTISADTLKGLRTVQNGRVTATYPNDPYLWDNWGWAYACLTPAWTICTKTWLAASSKAMIL